MRIKRFDTVCRPVRLPVELDARIQAQADREYMSVSDLMRRVLLQVFMPENVDGNNTKCACAHQEDRA